MSFENARVLAFESRRAPEIAQLIRNQKGDAFVAPALKEVPLAANTQALLFADRLYAGDFDMAIFLTGVGTRLLQRVLAEREPAEKMPSALRHVTVVARGPKPSAVLREWQVPITVQVPEPNTWRELLSAIANRPEKRVAVQEYGRSNPELLKGLAGQGRSVMRVPVYNWELPEDTEPLHAALHGLVAEKFDVALFTTGVQIEHFLAFADSQSERAAAIKALQNIFVASIGPTCTESLRSYGIEPAMEPTHPKMGILVLEAAEQYRAK